MGLGSLFFVVGLVASSTDCSSILTRISTLQNQPRYHSENIWDAKIRPASTSYVVYYDEAARSRFRLQIKNGAVHLGDILVSTGYQGLAASWDREFGIIVLDKNLRLLGYPHTQDDSIHHSSLPGGEEVFFAGTWSVVNGKIKKMTRWSGHYLPSEEHLVNFVIYMDSIGADLSVAEINIEIHESAFIPVSSVLPQLKNGKKLNEALAVAYLKTDNIGLKRTIENYYRNKFGVEIK